METINNAASAASKAIWGDSTTNTTQSTESGREPVSGETGNTASGEPYDAGNSADQTNTDSTKDVSNTESTKSSSDIPSSTANTDLPGNTANTGPIRSEHDTDKTGVTSAHQPSSGFSSDKPTSSNDTSGPGAAPSVGADPASGQQDTPGQQGAERPHDEPEGGSDAHQAILDAKKEAEEAQNVDTSGPGPKPLAETGGPSGPTGTSTSDDDGPQKESHGEGTGEKVVRASGMKADGGDFDAAAAGAGSEADRLLEDKGVHRAAEPSKDDGAKSDPLAEKADKPSLKDKIKAKLHKS